MPNISLLVMYAAFVVYSIIGGARTVQILEFLEQAHFIDELNFGTECLFLSIHILNKAAFLIT